MLDQLSAEQIRAMKRNGWRLWRYMGSYYRQRVDSYERLYDTLWMDSQTARMAWFKELAEEL